MSEAVDQFLADLNAQLEAETNEKITKAMRLFVRCDDTYKGIVLHVLGIDGPPLTAQRLRDNMDTLDLLDGLDSLIEDMEWDIEHNT